MELSPSSLPGLVGETLKNQMQLIYGFFEKNPMIRHQCSSRVKCVSASYFCSKATFTVYFYVGICTFILSALLYSGGVRWEFASHPTNCSIYTTEESSHGK
jgi:hypothetical protein